MSSWGFPFTSWFSSSSQNDDKFINAVKDNLIDTENIKIPLYRSSKRQYFDSENYPIPKMVYSPIWFALNKDDVIFYMKTYETTKTSSGIIVEYNLNPNYKILNLRKENRELDKQIMKILVDHVIDKIRNDNDKIRNIFVAVANFQESPIGDFGDLCPLFKDSLLKFYRFFSRKSKKLRGFKDFSSWLKRKIPGCNALCSTFLKGITLVLLLLQTKR